MSTRHTANNLPLPPGHHGHWLWRVREQVKDPLGVIVRAHQRHGDVVFFNDVMGPTYLLAHPDHAQRVLVDNARNFAVMGKSATGVMGNGLFASTGDFWLRQRRMVQPVFHRARLTKMVRDMVAETQVLAEHWDQAVRTGESVNLLEQMRTLVLTLLGSSLFSPDVYAGQQALREGAAIISHSANESPFDSLWWLLLRRLKVPRLGGEQWRATVASVDRALYALVSERRENPEGRDDILSMLLEARDSRGEGMTDKEVRDELATLLIGGHESTAVGLTWVWYALMLHPEVEQRVREELATVLGGQAPGGEALQSLTYTRAVVEETLRLYSPAWRLRRLVLEDEQIDGWTVRAGSQVMLSPYLLHRHPSVWKDPERFDPERFSPGQKEGRHRHAWLPFGGGQRLCVGNAYALTLLVTVIATLLPRFQTRLVPGHPVVPMAVGTYRPRSGIQATIHAAPPLAHGSSSTSKALSS